MSRNQWSMITRTPLTSFVLTARISPSTSLTKEVCERGEEERGGGDGERETGREGGGGKSERGEIKERWSVGREEEITTHALLSACYDHQRAV